MARWKVYDGEHAPQCTHCGMWAPFARYSRKIGQNGREISNYCPSCGYKMTGIDECFNCKYSNNGEWNDNGICFSCRADTWAYGKKQNERILNNA